MDNWGNAFMKGLPSFSRQLGLVGAVGLVFCCVFIVDSVSAAQYEGVGTFASAGEEVQLGGVGGMAININGTSGPQGAPPGSLYAVTRQPISGAIRVARFSSEGKFELAWGVTSKEEPYERCGPKVSGEPPCAPLANGQVEAVDVDIDQTTGNVYVLGTLGAGGLAVRVYTPDGSKVITRFGQMSKTVAEGDTTAASPEKIHDSPYPGGIAVNNSGEVYVFDLNYFDKFYHRLMVFKPQTPGDYEHYIYAGQGSDVGVGTTTGNWPSKPTSDAAGDIYVAGDEYIEQYDPAQPATPICKFKFPKGGITTYTVNRLSGELFFYTYKDKKIHQLSACSEGKFTELGASGEITVSPERDYLYALAYNPSLQWEVSRSAGVLYGAAPGPVPATGSGEPGKTSLGYVFAPVAEVLPVVESESVSGVTTTTADLQAEINPKGSQTSYIFQYLTRAAYEKAGEGFAGAEEAPAGGAALGAGQIPLSAVVTITDLAPDIEYVYRAIATSNCSSSEPAKVCEDAGPAQGFRTSPAEMAGPPDQRTYELVSPAQKNSGQVLPAEPNSKSCPGVDCKPGVGYQHFPMQSSPSGNAVVYEGDPFVPGQGAPLENEYLSRRGASGWETLNLTPSLLVSKGGQGYKAFDIGLTEGVFEQTNPSLSPNAPSKYQNLYRQPTASSATLTPLLTNSNAFLHRSSGIGGLELTYAGGSADLSRLFFEANDALTSETGEAEEKTNLYEWSGGVLHQVNLAPGSGTALPEGAFGSGMLLGSSSGTIAVSFLSHAISSDGSRAFWTGEDGETYVRVGGTETLKVPGPGSCKESVALVLRACFLTASADGSRVLLSNGQIYELNEGAGAYEAASDLTATKGGFLGMLGQSEDLSHVYFVGTVVLTGEEKNGQGAKAQAGKDNLYAWVEGVTTFVGTLLPADNGSPGDWQAAPVVRTAEASPGGRFVTFLSQAPLTGYDNTGPCKVISGTDEFEGGPCNEAFLYDSTTAELTCPSCNAANTRPLGPSVLRTILNVPGSLPQPRYLLDSGRLYFDSQDSLVPADTNGNAEDVYQYEPEGMGSCNRQGGCVSLISGGREATDSNFLAIDDSGANVFFTTRDRLAPADTDELIDLYDARVNGGFPPPPSVGECRGEGCQLTPPVPPESMPASPNVVDPGNVKPGGCKKGSVKRRGRCVKKPKHEKHKSQAKKAKQARGGAK